MALPQLREPVILKRDTKRRFEANDPDDSGKHVGRVTIKAVQEGYLIAAAAMRPVSGSPRL
jgi:hypothetical protein